MQWDGDPETGSDRQERARNKLGETDKYIKRDSIAHEFGP